MPRIVAVPHMPDDATRAPVAAERLVHGQPLQAVANAYSSQDERFHCGVWEGGVGAWRVQYTEHEFCHLLSGRVRLHDDAGGDVVVLEADQSFVVPAGFSGVWEVLEPARKLYAIYEPGD